MDDKTYSELYDLVHKLRDTKAITTKQFDLLFDSLFEKQKG